MKTLCFLLTLACSDVRPGVAGAGDCRIMITDSTTAADSAGVADACRAAAARYLELTARQAPEGTIVIGAFNGFKTEGTRVPWKFEWPSTSRCHRIGDKLGYAIDSASAFCANEIRSVLPHELGHVFDYAGLLEGTPPLPAWYDEAAAMWMEPDELQVHRLSQAHEWLRSAPDLASLMAVAHPRVMSEDVAFSRTETVGPCRGVCGAPRTWNTRSITWTILADGAAHADTLYDSAVSSVHSDSVARFYVYSLAILYYVKSRGGIQALHLLADRVRVPSHDPDILRGIPGIPAAGREREADWRSWLSTAATTIP